MILYYDKVGVTKEELEKVDRTNPYNVVGAFIQTISSYDGSDKFYDLVQYLVGDYQPLSALMKQQIKDRMSQNDKSSYIGKSYFKGATPDNDYNPTLPIQLEVTENIYSDVEEGYKKLFVKSGGADNERGITVRLAKDGNYYVWSDSFMGLLSDIRKPESTNPWA
ncbi:MAG: hypothetical protein Q4E69_05565 [Bacilli bacterium]|nr:hypothetical protein [Bacilli bacterium]